MKSETPKPVLLADYRPPEFLIDTVDLNIVLDPTRTRVISKLTMRRNPKAKKTSQGPAEARRRISRTCQHLAQRQEAEAPGILVTEDGPDDRVAAEGTVHARNDDDRQSRSQHGSARHLPVARRLLLAMRGAGLSAHHLFSRSSRRSGALHRPPRSRCCDGAGPACERQPGRARHACRRQAALCDLARPAPETLLSFCDRRRRSFPGRVVIRHAIGPQSRFGHLCRARQGEPRPLGDGRTEAIDAVGRGSLRPRV